MGQGYLCANIDKKEYLYSSGSYKLTEHSWIGNDFVESVEALLAKEWKNNRIVWAGQYMENMLFLPDGEVEDTNLYYYADKHYMELKPSEGNPTYRFIVNNTLKQFIDKNRIRDNNGWQVHPFPIITSSGNGQGGGDYHPINEQDAAFLGLWTGHRIYATNEARDTYEEIIPDFYP